MTVFGWDASDYDWSRGPMDLAAARRDGIDFFTHKATEATWTRHARFGEAMRRARDAGIPILGAYHVVRSPANAAAEVDFCLSYVDAQTPWWRDHPCWFWQVDLEKWSYDAVPASEGEAFADIIEQRTGRRAVIYASRGQYGDQLTGTSHELWNANYGTNPTVHYRTVYASRGGDSGPGWVVYSGRMPAIWQFGSRTTIGSQNICDANAFRGTLSELRALLGGDDMSEFSEADPWGNDPDGHNRTPAQKLRDMQAAVYFGQRPLNADGKPVGPEPWITAQVNGLRADLAKLSVPVPAPVDPAVVAAAVRDALADPAVLAAIATAVNDDAHRRSAE